MTRRGLGLKDGREGLESRVYPGDTTFEFKFRFGTPTDKYSV